MIKSFYSLNISALFFLAKLYTCILSHGNGYFNFKNSALLWLLCSKRVYAIIKQKSVSLFGDPSQTVDVYAHAMVVKPIFVI